jgi:hypothetical protein
MDYMLFNYSQLFFVFFHIGQSKALLPKALIIQYKKFKFLMLNIFCNKFFFLKKIKILSTYSLAIFGARPIT